jgi:hypothetical protein
MWKGITYDARRKGCGVLRDDSFTPGVDNVGLEGISLVEQFVVLCAQLVYPIVPEWLRNRTRLRRSDRSSSASGARGTGVHGEGSSSRCGKHVAKGQRLLYRDGASCSIWKQLAILQYFGLSRRRSD